MNTYSDVIYSLLPEPFSHLLPLSIALFLSFLNICWVALWHRGCVWCLFTGLGASLPDHTTAGRAVEPAEIKQRATSARNLQQIERREQNKPLSYLIPLFSLPFSLSIQARKPFCDYIRNQRPSFSTEGTDPARAFELLLCSLTVNLWVIRERDLEKKKKKKGLSW